MRTELEERLRFEVLLAETSLRFVNVPADQVDGEIEAAQRRICEFLNLDRATLWQLSEKEPRMLLTHAHHTQGAPRFQQICRFSKCFFLIPGKSLY